MTQETNISHASDPWLEATATALHAYQSENGSSLRDYVSPQRPPDPTHATIPGKSNLPVTDANRIHEINRTTVLVTPSGKEFPNPWGVSPTPIQINPTPRPLPTIEETQQTIADLRQAISAAIPAYESAKSDASTHDRLVAIGERLNVLLPEVQALQDEATELRARPTADNAFIAKVADLEFRTQSVAGNSSVALMEHKAQRLFGCSFKELSDEGQRDIRTGLKEFKDYITPYQVRFSRSENKTIAAARETLSRLLGNLDAVVNLIKKKLK
jgi:hypothetical protein